MNSYCRFKKISVWLVILVAMSLISATCTKKTSKKIGPTRLSDMEYKEILKDFKALNPIQISDSGIKAVEGTPDGYIVIHKFMDYQCSHCYDTSFMLNKAMERWPGRIKLVIRQFPLDGTCNPAIKNKQEGSYSCNGAQASLCVAGKPYFSKFHHALFSYLHDQKRLSIENIEETVKSLGGNWQEVLSCMGSAETARRLNVDLSDAEKVKVRSTPTLLVNGRLLPPGTPNEEYFFYLIDALVLEKEGASAFGGK